MKSELKWVGVKDGRIWGLIQIDDCDVSWNSVYYTFWGHTKTQKLYFQNIRNTTVRDRSFSKSVKRKKDTYTQVQTPDMNAHVMCEFEQLMLVRKLKQGG